MKRQSLAAAAVVLLMVVGIHLVSALPRRDSGYIDLPRDLATPTAES
jgi:hypothetical protein